MAFKKSPFDRVLTKRAASGANDLVTERVKAGWLWCVQHVAIENETNACTHVRLLKAGRGGEVVLEEQDSPEAAVLYSSDDDVYLMESQYLVARFTGCTASDVLQVYVSGWMAGAE